MAFKRRAKKEWRPVWIMLIVFVVSMMILRYLGGIHTKFFQAAYDGDTTTVNSLLAGFTGRIVNVNETTGRGSLHDSALMFAAKNGHLQTVKFLVSRGADVTQKNDKGETASGFAKKHGHHDIVQFLDAQYAPVQNEKP